MTTDFKELLRLNLDGAGKPYTQESWGRALGIGRTRLCQVLGNVAGRGGVRRPQVAKDIQQRFPIYASAMLACLGWDKDGNLLETKGGTFHVEHASAWADGGKI
jgi:hypothetical protein